MKPYPKYKPSDIQWLGDIPEHWEVKKLKYIVNGKLEYGANESAELEDRSLPRYIRITDFGNDGKLKEDTFKSLSEEVALGYLLQEGDILFARSGATVGKTFQFKNYQGVACYAGYLIKASPNSNLALSDFVYYFTKSDIYENWKNSIFVQATIQNIGADKYNQLELPIPPLPEQTAIAQFLDQKTAQIEILIAQKQRLITLLKEERMAFINEILSDESFPLKKLKYVVEGKLEYGANESAELDDRSLPRYIRITDFGNNGKLKDETFKSLPFEKANEYLLKDGDVLFARSGATVGKTFQFKNYEGIACFAGYLIKAMPNPKVILSDYLYYFTKSGIYENWKDSIFVQATIQNIGADKYNQLEIPVPSLKTQQKIVESIETTTSKIDATLAKIVQEIELLKEYRIALISEVVTGKISVV